MNENPPTMNYERPRPPKPWLSQADREAWGCLLAGLGSVLWFGSSIVSAFIAFAISFGVMQRVIVTLARGADRYAAGVRIVGKKTLHLSDGTALSGGWQALYMIGLLVCVGLLVWPYSWLMQKLGLVQSEDDEKPASGKDSQHVFLFRPVSILRHP